ncbi:hypothetical protein SNOG_08405 [Parastagonospora nodorum SN15]|uniref:J domain-containing protein n=1 Tax=Phaeosphaeria nodorum (strain SN15 / ATCC MYA-4574 / FGSC 10173) TaxID=321614 RepID=Q0UIK9_PHANO|nr:hypothetical protein SNOG_08405 [Parastagonospora nodorum SN15]EAT84681.1 hypothetical protein SNOG_08405 [Parastagonospora nodorum SN15]
MLVNWANDSECLGPFIYFPLSSINLLYICLFLNNTNHMHKLISMLVVLVVIAFETRFGAWLRGHIWACIRRAITTRKTKKTSNKRRELSTSKNQGQRGKAPPAAALPTPSETLRYHPDKQLSNDTSAFRKVNEAYEVLRNPLQRRKYDLTYNFVRRELETYREAWREYEKETEQQPEQAMELYAGPHQAVPRNLQRKTLHPMPPQ